jgi:Kef-type K+ transport system membrane component KefB
VLVSVTFAARGGVDLIDELDVTLAWLGALLLFALVAEWVGARTPLPRVSVLLLVGVVLGPPVLDLLPEAVLTGEPIATTLALTIVGFLLGSEFASDQLRENGRAILLAALISATVTAVVVVAGLLVEGASLPLALALGGIATATAPAATRVVVSDENSDGPMTRTLLGIIAIDDAICIVLFSVLVAIGVVVAGDDGTGALLGTATRELGGGVLLGVAVGVPAAWLEKRVSTGDPILMHTVGVVLLLAGLGEMLEVSVVLAAVVAGAVVVNLAHSEERPFQTLEGVQWPFLAVFFIYGGAALEWDGLTTYTMLTIGYIVLRSIGKTAGGYLAGVPAGLDQRQRAWLGPSLLPQAGVALGLALLARDRFPDLAETIVPVVVVSTVLFELVGPVMTRLALHRTGEAGSGG